MLKLRHALLASICLLPLLGVEALAATAGVTAAVNQNAKSTPPSGGVRTVVLGANVVQDERIETDGAGLVQILLADGTTFTVGPNSSLVIDRFVYDPDANTAEVAASLGRGVFRFIGGRTSKTEGGVTLNTPVGTVGIRGGMADLNFTGQGGNIAQIDLLFGNEVTLNGPNGGDRLFQPGYSIIIGPNGQPSVIKTPPGSANFIQQALAGRPGAKGGNSQQPSDDDVKNSEVANNNSGSTPPNPQDIPPPDLNAINLATPKPNDIHQVAEEVSGGDEEDDNYGRRGFSTGILVADIPSDDVFPIALTDVKGKTRIKLDLNGDVVGAKTVVGIAGVASVEGDEEYEVGNAELTVTAGDYPGVDSMTASFNDQPVYTTTNISTPTFLTGSAGVLDCDCGFADWGTWGTSFQGSVDGNPTQIKLSGHWITADLISPDAFDAISTQYNSFNLTYYGTAVGRGQYYTVDGVTPDFDFTGDVTVNWDFGGRTGDFTLNSLQGSGIRNDHNYSATTSIGEGAMASGSFTGTGTTFVDAEYLSVSGAFVDNNGDIPNGVIGNFGTYDAFETVDDEIAVFSGTGIFAGAAPTN